MRRTLQVVGFLSVSLAAVLLGRVAQAQSSTPPPYVFETVDAVEVKGFDQVVISGILQGSAEASTVSFSAGSSSDYASLAVTAQRCERFALLAMTKPGLYLLEVVSARSYSFLRCKLIRR